MLYSSNHRFYLLFLPKNLSDAPLHVIFDCDAPLHVIFDCDAPLHVIFDCDAPL